MNSRKRKKKLTKWRQSLNGEVDDLFYCMNCNKTIDLKRNKYALKYGTCDMNCYAEAAGVNLYER